MYHDHTYSSGEVVPVAHDQCASCKCQNGQLCCSYNSNCLVNTSISPPDLSLQYDWKGNLFSNRLSTSQNRAKVEDLLDFSLTSSRAEDDRLSQTLLSVSKDFTSHSFAKKESNNKKFDSGSQNSYLIKKSRRILVDTESATV